MDSRILMVVAVLAVSGCVSSNGETDVNMSEFNQSEPENVTMIYYTDTGFMPEEVTVSQGDEVRWVDESSGSMWVATDQHPVHEGYDGTSLQDHCPDGESFDQCEAGQVYSFTFDREGEWTYHNHRNSRHTGTVVVE